MNGCIETSDGLSLTTKSDAVLTTFYSQSFLLTASGEHVERDLNYTIFTATSTTFLYSCALFILNQFNEIFPGTEGRLQAIKKGFAVVLSAFDIIKIY